MKRTSLRFFRMAARSSDEQVSSELALAADDALTSDARQRAENRRLREVVSRISLCPMCEPCQREAERALAPKRGKR